MAQTLSDDALVRARGEVVSCTLGDGLALLDMDTSTYYSLNPVGAHIWQVIQSPTTVLSIRDSILDAFEVGAADCHADLLAVLDQLAGRKLIEVTDASAR